VGLANAGSGLTCPTADLSPANRGASSQRRRATPSCEDPPTVFISSAFAQTAAAGSTENTLFSLLPLVLMFVVLYFIMIRPQMKKQKEHKAMIDALAKGDEVVVGGGVIGRVAKLGDSFVHVEVASGVELQVQRAAVVQVLPKGTFK
jgi:preprotein translocase subunit YajC